MASIYVPVLYLVIVVGGLLIFSYFYRKKTKSKRLEPWFQHHRERDIYVTLLQQTNPPAAESLLKAALIRRAITDVNRVIRIREDKPALQNLLQKGYVSDDTWNAFLSAEKELEAEILEVMQEANSFVEGWGQFIFSTASEYNGNEKTKQIFDSIPEEKAKLDAKYNLKKKLAVSSEKAPISSSSTSSALSPPSQSSTTNSSTTPATTPEPTNGLAPPPTNVDPESATSSDGELVGPATPSKPTRSTPKSSSKKSKKRK